MELKAILLMTLLLSTGLSASIINSKSGEWDVASIWNTSAVPTLNDNVTINATTQVTIKSNASVDNLIVLGNLSINASLNTTDQLWIMFNASVGHQDGLIGSTGRLWVYGNSSKPVIFSTANASGFWSFGSAMTDYLFNYSYIWGWANNDGSIVQSGGSYFKTNWTWFNRSCGTCELFLRSNASNTILENTNFSGSRYGIRGDGTASVFQLRNVSIYSTSTGDITVCGNVFGINVSYEKAPTFGIGCGAATGMAAIKDTNKIANNYSVYVGAANNKNLTDVNVTYRPDASNDFALRAGNFTIDIATVLGSLTAVTYLNLTQNITVNGVFNIQTEVYAQTNANITAHTIALAVANANLSLPARTITTGATAFSSWTYIYNNGGNLIHNSNSDFIMNGSANAVPYLGKNTTFWNLVKDGTAFMDVDSGGALVTLHTAANLSIYGGGLQSRPFDVTGSNVNFLVNGTAFINSTFRVSPFGTGQTNSITFYGNVSIENAGVLGVDERWWLNVSGIGNNLLVKSGGTLSLPNASGITYLNGTTFLLNGTMEPNGGTVEIGPSSVTVGDYNTDNLAATSVYKFHNLTLNGNYGTSGACCVARGIRLNVTQNLRINAGKQLTFSIYTGPANLTLGNMTQSGTLSNGGTAQLHGGSTGAPNFVVVRAGSTSFRFTWEGNTATLDDVGGDNKQLSLVNGIFNPATTTGTPHNIFVNLTNMTLNGAWTFSPSDTLILSPGYTIFNSSLTLSNGANMTSSFANLTIVGAFTSATNISTLNDTIINAHSSFSLSGGGNTTLTNVTFTNNTPVVSGSANLTVRWRNIKVVDENGAAINGAVVNVTQTGTTVIGTTGSDGILQAIVEDYQNIGGTTTLKSAVLNGSKAGQLNNAFTDNVTSNERFLVLAPSGGATSGFNNGTAVMGTPTSTTFTPSIKVNSLTVKGPWQGVQNVTILDSASNVVVNFTHNFSAGGLPANYFVVDTGAGYAGINGGVFSLLSHFNESYTLNVPTRDAICNTQVCTGQARTKDTDCSSTDWSTTASMKVGNYCLAAVSGTVVRDQSDLTSIVSVPELSFVWIIAIFSLAFVIFVRFKE